MSLKVWLRHSWVDKRLAWNESEHGGISMIALSTSDPQQIWVPDLQPYNSLTSIGDTLSKDTASVYSDGSIFWSRAGLIELMCKFSGLVAFPYDNLQCSLEIGGWTWSGSHQGIEPFAAGAATFSSQEATAGASYTEYTIKEIQAEPVIYEYPCCPSEPWPVIFYTITLHRASQYYFHLLLWPYIALTSLSFLVFFMSHEVGERLGFGITLILAIEVSKTVFSGMVPVCGEALWLELFSALNLIFCIVALGETCIVLFLAFHEDPHLVPPWIVELFMACMPRCLRSRQARPKVLPHSAGSEKGSSGAYATVTESDIAKADTSLASQLTRSMGFADFTAETDESNQQAATRLSLFERYFMCLDSKATGTIPLAACYSWLTYTCVKSSPSEIWEAVNRANKDYDESIVPSEFMQVCTELLWDVPLDLLETLHETATQVVEQRSKRDLLYWNRVAKRVDRHSRLWIPAMYYSLLIVLINVDFRDNYLRPPTDPTKLQTTGVVESSMFAGIGIVHTTGLNVFCMLLVPLVVILLVIGSCVLASIARSRNVVKPRSGAKLAAKDRQKDELINAVSHRISRRVSGTGGDNMENEKASGMVVTALA